MAAGELKYINVKDIRNNKEMLREVNRSGVGYLELVESVRQAGILNAISVRAMVDSKGVPYYALVDGLHRTTAARDVGLETVPAQVLDASDAETLEYQLLGNIHTIETKPVEYSEHLKKILALNPTMSKLELATKLAKSGAWLDERLNLLKLNKGIQASVDGGQINLANAYALAKLPEDEQLHWVDRAMTQPPNEFTPAVLNRKKELDKAKRSGKDAPALEFVATPNMRKLAEVKDEMDTGRIGQEQISRHGIDTPLAAWNHAVKWFLRMDPDEVAMRKKQDDDRKAELAKKRDAAAAERKKELSAKATDRAAQLQVESQAIADGLDPAEAVKLWRAELAAQKEAAGA